MANLEKNVFFGSSLEFMRKIVNDPEIKTLNGARPLEAYEEIEEAAHWAPHRSIQDKFSLGRRDKVNPDVDEGDAIEFFREYGEGIAYLLDTSLVDYLVSLPSFENQSITLSGELADLFSGDPSEELDPFICDPRVKPTDLDRVFPITPADQNVKLEVWDTMRDVEDVPKNPYTAWGILVRQEDAEATMRQSEIGLRPATLGEAVFFSLQHSITINALAKGTTSDAGETALVGNRYNAGNKRVDFREKTKDSRLFGPHAPTLLVHRKITA